MRRALSATLGVAALLAVPTTASAADSVIVKYRDGAATKSRTAAADRAGVSKRLGSVDGHRRAGRAGQAATRRPPPRR